MKNGIFASVAVSVHAAAYNLWALRAARFPCPGGDTDYWLTIHGRKRIHHWPLLLQVEMEVHILEGSREFSLEKGLQQ